MGLPADGLDPHARLAREQACGASWRPRAGGSALDRERLGRRVPADRSGLVTARSSLVLLAAQPSSLVLARGHGGDGAGCRADGAGRPRVPRIARRARRRWASRSSRIETRRPAERRGGDVDRGVAGAAGRARCSRRRISRRVHADGSRVFRAAAERRVDVEALVRSACGLGPRRTGAGGSCSTGARAGRSCAVEAGRLGQALDNLIANALEHGARPRHDRRAADRELGHGLGARPRRRSAAARSNDLAAGVVALAHEATAWRSCGSAVEDHGGRMRLVRESRGTGVQISAAARAGVAGRELPSRRRGRPASGPPGVARSA